MSPGIIRPMRRLLLLLLAAVPVFAQLPSNTVSVTASRSMILQPDQVLFTLTVSSGLSTTVEQAAAALARFGITSADLTGVQNPAATSLAWNFSLATPLTNLTTTLASLVQLQQAIGQNTSGLTLTFSVTGTQVSPQLQESQQSQSCSDSDLIADATAQAQKLASAAGRTLGPILRLTNAPVSQQLSQPAFAAARLGSFTVSNFLSVLLLPQVPSTCSLTVVFQLLP